MSQAPPSVELQTRNNWWGYGPNNNGGAATSKDMLKGSPFKAQVRSLLALPVQKYKYFLALLVQKCKYIQIHALKGRPFKAQVRSLLALLVKK